MVRKKKDIVCKKMSIGERERERERKKKPFRKTFIFFVDKLNMIDFNIFSMLKLIFTWESCAISITE